MSPDDENEETQASWVTNMDEPGGTQPVAILQQKMNEQQSSQVFGESPSGGVPLLGESSLGSTSG